MGLPDDEVEQLVNANARRLRSFADLNTAMLIEIVRVCRQQGFAYHDERLLKGVSGVAVPVADNSGKILGAICITAMVPILESEVIYEVVARLRREAAKIQVLLVKDVGSKSS